MSLQVNSLKSREIPKHLQRYVVEQNYSKYTPVDHAVWRYVMRQLSSYLAENGKVTDSYFKGLELTGLLDDRIPRLEELNERLSAIGWGCVAVDGFVPSEVFYGFQANRILPIAVDIRTVDNIDFSAAPDIIHESLGHAPVLFDPTYLNFVERFGEINSKVLTSKKDSEVFESNRELTILKDDPNATEETIRQAELRREKAIAMNNEDSEVTQAARLYWWTVETGLVGDLDNPIIYGSSLLSSMKESRDVLKEETKKIPFDLDLVLSTDFDVLQPQPQVFVIQSFEHLHETLDIFENLLSLRQGGTKGLKKALESGGFVTIVYQSGLQVSGRLEELVYDEDGEVIWMRTVGPSYLAAQGQVLAGHGCEVHIEGFSSPIGKLLSCDTPLEECSDEHLQDLGLLVGRRAQLLFSSGLIVEGIVVGLQHENGQLILVKWEDAKVTFEGRVLVHFRDGIFDMAVGASVVSVFAGPADPNVYPVEAEPVPYTTKVVPHVSEDEKVLHDLYAQIRLIREECWQGKELEGAIVAVLDTLDRSYEQELLLRLEVQELLTVHQIRSDLQERVHLQLAKIADANKQKQELIERGLHLFQQSLSQVIKF